MGSQGDPDDRMHRQGGSSSTAQAGRRRAGAGAAAAASVRNRAFCDMPQSRFAHCRRAAAAAPLLRCLLLAPQQEHAELPGFNQGAATPVADLRRGAGAGGVAHAARGNHRRRSQRSLALVALQVCACACRTHRTEVR